MKTVLLVEDNTDNTLLIEDVFAFEGVAAKLVCVASAEEALAFAATTPPDLVLMDIGLPGMCGLEATRRLRADPATRRVPIWAVTARALKEDEDAARNAGCDFYITKPFDQEDLGYMVKFVVAATLPEVESQREAIERRPR
jgi:two-component system cell cycle response regulator DivK